MTKITGQKSFNNYELAIKLYDQLDKAGYNVALCSSGKAYTVSYEGYTENIPLKGIEK